MIDLRNELYAVPEYEWRHVPITVSRHKWQLRWYRGDDGEFFFAFDSPKQRRYSCFVERDGGRGGRGRVTDASVITARGYSIASYRDVWGDAPQRMDAVIRLTPKHILDKLSMLLDAVG